MDNDKQGIPDDTLEVYVHPRRIVVAGAIIVGSLRDGCTPREILEAVADGVDIPRDEYIRHVLGLLDGTWPGDLG